MRTLFRVVTEANFLTTLVITVFVASLAFGHRVQAHEDKPHAIPAHWHSNAAVVKTYQQLMLGGNTVFFRHAKTDALGADSQPFDFGDCPKQRNLSAAGRAASAEMGEAMRLLKIPVGKVLVSPYCRTIETARLAFGRAEPQDWLVPMDPGKGWTMAKSGEALKAFAAAPQVVGVNNIVVAHIFNTQHGLGLLPEEGEALVLQPDGGGGVTLAGRITMTQWGDLVRDIVVQKMKPENIAAGGHGHGGDAQRHPAH